MLSRCAFVSLFEIVCCKISYHRNNQPIVSSTRNFLFYYICLPHTEKEKIHINYIYIQEEIKSDRKWWGGLRTNHEAYNFRPFVTILPENGWNP